LAYYVAGLDEVGRGSFAGPMVAVAAMFAMPEKDEAGWLTKHSPIPGVNDSKKFSTREKREEVYHRILRSEYLVDFGVGFITVDEIDKVGIDMANRQALFDAWRDLKHEPHFLLVDGDRPAPHFCYSQQKHRPQGDGHWWPVGAASILAKVIRDLYMVELGLDYPHYRWGQNSGYGTPDHAKAIELHGVCPLHRKQFTAKYQRSP
jgi:ribonuclease HII